MSSLLSADISVLARRYLRPCPQISLPVAFHDPINSANGLSLFFIVCEACPEGQSVPPPARTVGRMAAAGCRLFEDLAGFLAPVPSPVITRTGAGG